MPFLFLLYHISQGNDIKVCELCIKYIRYKEIWASYSILPKNPQKTKSIKLVMKCQITKKIPMGTVTCICVSSIIHSAFMGPNVYDNSVPQEMK